MTSEQTAPLCPQCRSPYAYRDGSLWICPECAHEWSALAEETQRTEEDTTIKDAHGNELQDGDTVSIIKDLKVKGSSSSIKVGTKIKSIRLITDSTDGHNISCKVDGFGAMNIKSEFVKKIS
ncbi:MAG: alkylphosphonate utilization protein [Halobacteriovoraceae bacterium]|nr:alkylphosphonate utilization protein [Halobacteriovoraceae bacterium]MCB9095302.1 alkylphosphonate utilization protein [Halobacteriovoraceae bacterium]